MNLPTPQEHIDNLEWLVKEGEYDDVLHQRFHQSNWYTWTCKGVDNHIKYFQRSSTKSLQGANASYAVFIQALVDHIKLAICLRTIHCNQVRPRSEWRYDEWFRRAHFQALGGIDAQFTDELQNHRRFYKLGNGTNAEQLTYFIN